MKSLKAIVFSLAAGALLMACAGPSYYVDPSWKGQPQPASVKVVYTEPEIANADDLKDDLPEYEANFTGWLEPQMKTFLYERSNKKVEFTLAKVDALSSETVKLGKEDFAAPSYAQMADDAEVYLVLDKVWVGREGEQSTTVKGNAASESMDPMGTGFTTANFFKVKGEFAFYDAKTKKILAYGRTEGKAQYQFAVSKGDWEFALRDFASHLLTDTPVYHW